MEPTKNRELFQCRIYHKERILHLNVVENPAGARALSIRDRNPATGRPENRIHVFQDQAEDFVKCLQSAICALQTGQYVDSD